MSTTSTPLRYPGGKSRLARFFSFLLRQNKISDCTYIEPFAGGAGAGINLLRKEYVRVLYLNDIDPGVYAFWYSLLNHTEDLCSLVAEVPLTMEEWHSQKEILRNPTAASPIGLGFAVLFLNRTNRSGIITGGVIGGQKQTGKWKIDARFNRAGLIEKIRRIAGYRHRIQLFCMDARDFLSNVVAACQERAFIYLDPPYYRKGQALYENNYRHDDHLALAQALKTIGGKPWVVSYNNVPQIREAYDGLPHLTYGLNYSASERYEGKEIMFFGPTITQPLLKNPLSVKHYA
ncbi:MAG: DNA adenine methylase [Thermodesulfobacteriota bacterium]